MSVKLDLEDLNTGSCQCFRELYPSILRSMLMGESNVQKSRNGNTFEIMNFKTIIRNPLDRVVYGHGRGINIAFLIAEAMWIWVGKKDVKFLKIFNSRMSDYSDNGAVFHAPYGYRLRNWGVSSNDDSKGLDQIRQALKMLDLNKNDRRAVCSIWNPDLDLNTSSVDLPCNDMLMFKIRDGKLNITIQNRSNDLHWGLPTNVFQFSFIQEVMADILGVEMGTEVHNSDSLHIYTNNELSLKMLHSICRDNGRRIELIHNINKTCLGFGISELFNYEDSIDSKIEKVDEVFNYIINLVSEFNGEVKTLDFYHQKQLYLHKKIDCDMSNNLTKATELLLAYTLYKNSNDKKACIDFLLPQFHSSSSSSFVYNNLFASFLLERASDEVKNDAKYSNIVNL